MHTAKPAPKARPRIQRALFSWLRRVHDELDVPVTFAGRDERHVKLSFPFLPNTLFAEVTRSSVEVVVEWQGQCWDFLYSRIEQDGSDLDMAVLGHVPPFRRREDRWQTYLFEPFRYWVNQTLAPAGALALYQHDGATWAELVSRDTAVASHLIALLPLPPAKDWIGTGEGLLGESRGRDRRI